MPILIAGSYEKFLWGYTYNLKSQTVLNHLFTYSSHISPIKSIAAVGTAAASAASDDSIKLYDLSTSCEIGSILVSNPVNVLSFFASPAAPTVPRHLITGGGDGSVEIYDVDPFVSLKKVDVHKKGINDLTVHPSGRVALTVARDASLGMVNLVRGRRSFSCRLDKEADIVKYSGDGKRFFMVSGERIGVHESEDAKIICEMEGAKRILCVAMGEDGLLITGGEDRNITAWDHTSGKVAYCTENAHSSRIKGLVVFKNKNNSQNQESSHILASASSDGVIRTWDLRMIAKENPTPLAEANTNSRLTCLAGSSVR